MKKKLDKALTGVIFGSLLPILGFFISYPVLTRGINTTFEQYKNLAINSPDHQQNVLIFCMLPNMFLFYFTNFRWAMNNFTKGLVAVTILLGLALVILTYS